MNPDSIQGERSARVRAVIEQTLRRREAGESLADALVVAQHADLMPELAAELARLAPTTPSDRNVHDTRSRGSDPDGGELPSKARAELLAAVRRSTRFPAGKILAGRYRIVELLGRGGMGEVYRADDLLLEQPVALKFLPEELADDADRMGTLMREVRTALRATHSNVCRVHDLCRADGYAFITMEYVDGEDLASLLRRVGRVAPTRAIEIARQLCAGLAALHQSGVLHRDLKPANVMIDKRGDVRITDFGLAIPHTQDAPEGSPLRAGTPAYMAPEQFQGDPVTPRSDIYALGLVLYELFTGRYAFDGDTGGATRRPSMTPRRPTLAVPDLDPRVERAILRCLERDPNRRPSDVRLVAAALPAGDPLTQALAAGEIPSPDVVAAAGAAGNLQPRQAVALLAGVLIGLLAVAKLNQDVYLFARTPLPKSAEVLANHAREALAAAGFERPASDSAYGFEAETQRIERVLAGDERADRWDWIAEGRPPAIRFWYRQSDEPIVARGFNSIVTYNDPPLHQPGASGVVLDPDGRLIELRVHPPPARSEPHRPVASAHARTDWDAILRAAGIDESRAERAEMSPDADAPPVFCDERARWRVRAAQRGEPISAEGGSFQGRPVFFRVRFEGDPEFATSAAGGPEVVARINFGIRVATLIGAVALALWNMRGGRGDLRGAARLASYVFIAYALIWALRAGHTPSAAEEWELLMRGAARALFHAAWVWTLYVALEPYVRRWWPQCLISWGRLLSGKLRDPMVGRDLLIGALLAIATQLVAILLQHAPTWLGLPPVRPLSSFLGGLVGAREIVGEMLWGQVYACLQPMLVLLVILLARVWFQSAAPGIALAVVLFTAPFVFSRHDAGQLAFYVDAVVFAGIILAWILVLLRFGLLATIAAGLYLSLISYYTFAGDLRAIYFESSLLIFVVAAGLAIFGFVHSLGGRALLSDPLAEG